MPSMMRSEGISAPAQPASVGSRSIVVRSSSVLDPAGINPGHHAMPGMRKPPSAVV